ncbi:MaoC/PaaZ C-terminal domain-containing protein [Catenulispora rubra]|uniref:MaoC/PaaZ C-terminal domain-containing protein n=1 Tax=Catenulispora rubra TaxID=280293 RepID=UPI0018927B93|nr:MaoC/PaaZ C-terminal domain-containing protein [Catenulispora rubra]
MPIDPEKALAAPATSIELAWTPKDVQLYHLGLGAGVPATDAAELAYVYEKSLKVLPSFAVVAGGALGFSLFANPGIDIQLVNVLHGGQSVTVHRALPTSGQATATARVTDVWDKGKAAVIRTESVIADADGPIWTSHSQIFVRGEGGFGGERGPSTVDTTPEREPDHVVEVKTLEQLALIYRLSGDWNPLHADPEFAAMAGFDRPILHGLCSYGITCKAVVDTVLAGDVTRVTEYSTRFAGIFFPGETMRVKMWDDGAGRVDIVSTSAERDDAVVLANTVLTYKA